MSESQSFDNAKQIMSWLKMTEMPLEDLSQETSFVSNIEIFTEPGLIQPEIAVVPETACTYWFLIFYILILSENKSSMPEPPHIKHHIVDWWSYPWAIPSNTPLLTTGVHSFCGA
jgi:hypothetical protein